MILNCLEVSKNCFQSNPMNPVFIPIFATAMHFSTHLWFHTALNSYISVSYLHSIGQEIYRNDTQVDWPTGCQHAKHKLDLMVFLSLSLEALLAFTFYVYKQESWNWNKLDISDLLPTPCFVYTPNGYS